MTIHAITVGPDGNLWFVAQEIVGKNQAGIPLYLGLIERVTSAGVITKYPLSTEEIPVGITSGSDGKVWFAAGIFPKDHTGPAEQGEIGWIKP